MSPLANNESISPLSTGRYMTSKQSAHLKIAKKGDTVSKLCLETYGLVNTRVLEWLKSYNPHIANMDVIQIDEIIFFPKYNFEHDSQEIVLR